MFKFITLWYLKRNIRIMERKLSEMDSLLLKCQDYPPLSAKADELRKRFTLLKSLIDVHKAKVYALQNMNSESSK